MPFLLSLNAAGAESQTIDLKLKPHAEDVVYSLYHDYGWEAMLGDRLASERLTKQKTAVLAMYFDPSLTALIERDSRDADQTGEEGALDFNPIFGSQDPAVADLQVGKANNGLVTVTYREMGTNTTVTLNYHLDHGHHGWRIQDITYTGELSGSLRKILSASR